LFPVRPGKSRQDAPKRVLSPIPLQSNAMDGKVATLQVATRHLGKRLFRYRAGTSDEPVMQQMFIQRDYDVSRLSRAGDLVGFYQQIVTRGRVPLIIDAGANIGASTLYLADSWPDARVIAIEPDPVNMDMLCGNTGGLPNISCIQAALAAHTGEMLLVD